LALAGIDTEEGLKIAQGNEKLYRRLLGKFRESQADFVSHFAAAREAEESDLTVRLAHTLKGVAASIGAKALQGAAQALEAACKNAEDDARIVALVDAVEQQLDPVIEGLNVLTAGTGQDVAFGTTDRTVRLPEQQLQRLRALLEDDDCDAVDLIAELLDQQLDDASRERLVSIEAAVADYDFTRALELLNAFTAA
jgi:HPt (histidine-containing phosphotransfer) domain-containing protein